MRKSRRKKGKRKILPSSAIGKMKLKVLFNFSMPLVNYAASNGHTRVAYPESLQEVAKSAERKMLSWAAEEGGLTPNWPVCWECHPAGVAKGLLSSRTDGPCCLILCNWETLYSLPLKQYQDDCKACF